MARRITCIALVTGSVTLWKMDGGRQIVLAMFGLSVAPTLALGPLAFLNPGIIVFLWGLTACILIVFAPVVAIAAVAGWTCLCFLPTNAGLRPVSQAVSMSTALLGLFLLIGRWASQAAEKPPPIGTEL